MTGTMPDTKSIASMARWLMWRIDGLAQHPEGAEAIRDITEAVDRCHDVIDRPVDRTYAGPCDECSQDLYAASGKDYADCKPCELRYPLTERRTWLLDQIRDQLATATEIARALTSLTFPITPERIRQWKRRDRITIRGHDRNGDPMYRVGDAIDLITTDKTKAAS